MEPAGFVDASLALTPRTSDLGVIEFIILWRRARLAFYRLLLMIGPFPRCRMARGEAYGVCASEACSAIHEYRIFARDVPLHLSPVLALAARPHVSRGDSTGDAGKGLRMPRRREIAVYATPDEVLRRDLVKVVEWHCASFSLTLMHDDEGYAGFEHEA
eukprot:scaffold22630_cov29-Tisochrysis_lutea.AAC.3